MMTRNELKNEIDMLQDNIHRIMESNNAEEIATNYDNACKRLAIIYSENIIRQIGRAHV